MKKGVIILLATMSFVATALAQTDVDLEPEVGARVSVGFDKKLAKGLHLRLEEEVRMDDNFGALDRLQTAVGISYKVNSLLKVGGGYVCIMPVSRENGDFKSLRHRLFANATVGTAFGPWRLSLRERVQGTYRSGSMNTYQSPRVALALKSRIRLSYKGWRRWEPHVSLELLNTLNAPVIAAAYNESTGLWVSPESGLAKNEAGWFLDGFTGMYVNRVRGELGYEYTLSKKSSIDVTLLADWNTDKVVDANAEGTKLKDYTREQGFFGALVVGYQYSF